MTYTFEITTFSSLQQTASMLAKNLDQSPYIITLDGVLGAGKTTFVQFLLEALGYQGHVSSPSYALVNSYSVSGLRISHADFYRLEDEESLELLGWDLILDNSDIVLIEWPRAFKVQSDIRIKLYTQNKRRYLTIDTQIPLSHLSDLH